MLLKVFVSCVKVVGKKKKGMNRPFKSVCGKAYALQHAAELHNKQYHAG